jgi:hypothetical protein
MWKLVSGAALVAVVAAAVVLAVVARWTGGTDRPRPRGAATAIVWAVGDGATGSRAAKRVAATIAAGRVDRFLYLGDVYERGTAAEFASNYHTVYGRLARITSPTPGNHEWPNRRHGYNAYWRGIKARTPPPYYAFRLRGWTILSLNSEIDHDSSSPQIRWLRRIVRGGGTCRLAFWHRPRHSAGSHRDVRHVEPFWDALRGRAAIVVNGHDHNLQRFAPRRGMTQFVAGAGGRRRYPVDESQPGLAYANDAQWGALRLELARGVARWAFVNVRARVLDSGTIRCVPESP